MHKTLLLIFLELYCCSGLAQITFDTECKEFTLEITDSTKKLEKIVFWYGDCSKAPDSNVYHFKNGKIKIKGTIYTPFNYSEIFFNTDKLYLGGSNSIVLIMEPGITKVTVSTDENKNILYKKIVGSSAQKDWDNWKDKNYNIVQDYELMSTRSYSGKKTFNDICNEIGEKVIEFIEQYPDSYLGPVLIDRYLYQVQPGMFNNAFYKLTPKVKNCEYSKKVANELMTKKLDSSIIAYYYSSLLYQYIKNLTTVFDATLTDTAGKAINLHYLKGNYLFVNFWASWCGPCIAAIPDYVAVKEKFKDQNINFITISIDTRSDSWKKSLNKNPIHGTNFLDSIGIMNKFYNLSYAVPKYMLFGPEGKVITYEAPRPGSGKLEEYIIKEMQKTTGVKQL